MFLIILAAIAAAASITSVIFHIRYKRQKNRIESVRARVNHDLRSPLNAVLGFSDLLQQSERDEETVRFISAIKSGGESMLSIIEEIGTLINSKDMNYIRSGINKITRTETVPSGLKKTLPANNNKSETGHDREPLILIVDDLMDNVVYLEKVLQKSGFRTISALDGSSALDLLTDYTPDLILLDIVMPGMDGFETCTRIQNNKDFIDIPVIFLSAKKDERTIIESFIYGGIDYIIKPFNSPELLARVNTHIQLKSAKAELHKLAYTDTLTGIYNRRKFIELLDQERARAFRYTEKLSLIMIDIDHFKNINDTFGHDTGDLALIKFSNIIKTSLRETDYPGRLGGEEFGVLLPQTDIDQAEIVAERIRAKLENESEDKEQQIPSFTASFGIAQFNENHNQSSLFTREADKALYRAKETGRNKICRAEI